MSAPANIQRRTLLREVILNAGLVLAGVLLLPVAVYLVGQLVFGEYGGDGYGDFFGALAGRLAGGELSAWFLVLSPLLVVLLLRALLFGWRRTSVTSTEAP